MSLTTIFFFSKIVNLSLVFNFVIGSDASGKLSHTKIRIWHLIKSLCGNFKNKINNPFVKGILTWKVKRIIKRVVVTFAIETGTGSRVDVHIFLELPWFKETFMMWSNKFVIFRRLLLCPVSSFTIKQFYYYHLVWQKWE